MGQIVSDFARDVIPQVGGELIKGRLVDSLGGGGLSSRMINAPLTGFTPVNFSTPGFEANFSNGTLDITRTPELQNSLTGASEAFGQQASSLGELLSQVTPGFGRFTEAAVSSLENRRRRAVGNLRENLARRRIAGSSFANDAIARLEAEFAQGEAEARSQAFLRELQASNDLINQQAEAKVNEFKTFINQANLEGQTAAQLSNNASILEAANARDLAQITQEQAEDFGAGLDPVLETVGNAAVKAGTAAVGGLLNGDNPFSGSAPETAPAVTTPLPAQQGGTFTPIGDIPTGIGVPSLGAGTLAGEAPALTAPVSSASLGGSLAGTGAFEATGGVPVAAESSGGILGAAAAHPFITAAVLGGLAAKATGLHLNSGGVGVATQIDRNWARYLADKANYKKSTAADLVNTGFAPDFANKVANMLTSSRGKFSTLLYQIRNATGNIHLSLAQRQQTIKGLLKGNKHARNELNLRKERNL